MSDGIAGAGPHVWTDNDQQQDIDPRDADAHGGGSHSKPEGHVGDEVQGKGHQPAAGVGHLSPGLQATGFTRGPEMTPAEALRAGVPEGNPYWSGNEIKTAARESSDDSEVPLPDL